MFKDRILVVEDAPELREMLELYLQEAGYAVESTALGRECLRLVEQDPPSLVLLDIGLPDIDGLSVVARLRASSPNMGVMLVTARDDDFDRIVGLEAGADCYLTKPVNLRVLLAQVRSLMRRYGKAAPDAPSGLRLGRFQVDLLYRRILDEHGEDVSLTPGEFALLIGLIERRGKVVSRQQLLSSMRMGPDEEADLRTVDTLIGRLRRKLERSPNRPLLVQTVYGKGYRLAAEGEVVEELAPSS